MWRAWLGWRNNCGAREYRSLARGPSVDFLSKSHWLAHGSGEDQTGEPRLKLGDVTTPLAVSVTIRLRVVVGRLRSPPALSWTICTCARSLFCDSGAFPTLCRSCEDPCALLILHFTFQGHISKFGDFCISDFHKA